MGGRTGGKTGRATRGSAREAAGVEAIISRLEGAHPDARLALDFSSPLELLVALILAAQCTDAKVNEVTRSLFARFRSAADYAGVAQEELEEAVRPTGFYRQKAKAVRACCRELVERHGGQVPADLDALLRLPGVGRKTANILLGNAYGRPGIGVDTHVGRLAQRLGLSRNTDPDKIEADLTPVVPARNQVRFCHLLQYHGRRVCFARRPSCPQCVLLDVCPYPDKTVEKGKKPRPPGSRWVGKRPAGGGR
jgi:endonuclease-3